MRTPTGHSSLSASLVFVRQHPALVHLLGLGPMLAITQTAAAGLVYGIACLFVIVTSSLLAGFLPKQRDSLLWLPLMATIVATTASIAELAMQQYAFAFTRVLGIYLPLLASQSLIYLVSVESSEIHSSRLRLQSAFTVGFAYLLALTLLGGARELIGSGTLFADFNLVVNQLDNSSIKILGETWRFKLAELAPGAFIILGFAMALLNIIKANTAADNS